MPTYQYRCANGHEVEVVQAFTDAALSECPQCGASIRKVYGSVGVVFKGSGFYRNDSREGSASTTASKPETKSDPATVTAKTDSAKSDSKPSTPASSTSTSSSSTSGSSSSSGSAA